MIVKMKFLSITGPQTDIDRVVETYLSKYEIHLENALAELNSVKNLTPFIQINPYKETLKLAENYMNLISADERTTDKKLTLEESIEFVQNLDHLMAKINEERGAYQAEFDKYQALYKKIEPFMALDFNIASILEFEHIRCRFGKIPKDLYAKFKTYVYDNIDTVFYQFHADDQYVWGIYFCLAENLSKVDAVYASMHFEQVYLPNAYEGTPRQAHDQLEQKLQEIHAKITSCDAKIQNYLKDHTQELIAAYEHLSALSKNFDVRKLAACTDSKDETFFILCGWMSEEDTVAFQKEIAGDEKVVCMIEDNDTNPDTVIPTKLKNPKLFRPFQMFIEMYGLPAYGEMDPTIFVALTYSFIFGTMFGDVGQGLCLLLGGALLYKFKKIPLAAILSMAGIFSTIFGFLYGSIFGFEELIPALWLKPKTAMTTLPFIGTMNTVFVVAIAFGMFMILTTMILHIITAIKEHDIENILFEQNAISGFVFYASLVAVIFLYMTGHTLPGTLVLVIMFGIPLLLIMMKEPLTRMIEKRTPAIEGGKGMFFVQSFFEMFEVMLSYMSNTLSFVRMGAFAVSHAAMMEVVLMLAGAEHGGSPNWIVVVLGNIFVCGMEGLIVAIQVLRLEYYEMFSRFYKGSGRPFKPFLKKSK